MKTFRAVIKQDRAITHLATFDASDRASAVRMTQAWARDHGHRCTITPSWSLACETAGVSVVQLAVQRDHRPDLGLSFVED